MSRVGQEGLNDWRRERWGGGLQTRLVTLNGVLSGAYKSRTWLPNPRPFADGTGEHCALLAPGFLRPLLSLRSERPGPRGLIMFPWGLSCLSVLGAAGTAVLCAGLLLSLAQHLWTLRWMLSRDRASTLPLPKGSMGWPFFGETLHWLVQGSRFHSSRRERYGTVFKTHLLGRPVIRVSGAENVRTILLGEHRLVRSQWPQSAHILLGSHTLLGAVGEPHRRRRKGIRARDQLHQHLEGAISEKLHEDKAAEPGDALELIIHSARELGHEPSMQELKESAVELLFAAFFTTASASTSLVLLLLQHPAAIAKIREELVAQGLGRACGCAPGAAGGCVGPPPDCGCEPDLSLAALGSLRYVDCVVKEVLRLLPPVSGGYRTALRTFELDGYQIPKGWSVMYSIRDTHETAAVYRSPPEGFDPERFGAAREDSRGASSRFHYIPFGGGARSCLGQELAQTVLQLLAVELVRTARWELATPAFPAMQTVPIVHPVDGLRLFFHPLAPLVAGDGLCL
ncbi:cytochrome P450 26C1 isoform X2 [Macaca fascicularis]|uniref:cytochrome P450 26C1 isoform X2 n=1 Tax=Macaca fascicularis TaxID=9541 RepID=UPI0032B05BDE